MISWEVIEMIKRDGRYGNTVNSLVDPYVFFKKTSTMPLRQRKYTLREAHAWLRNGSYYVSESLIKRHARHVKIHKSQAPWSYFTFTDLRKIALEARSKPCC